MTFGHIRLDVVVEAGLIGEWHPDDVVGLRHGALRAALGLVA